MYDGRGRRTVVFYPLRGFFQICESVFLTVVVRYEDVVTLGDISPRPTAMSNKTHQMMIEARLRTRGDHNEKKRLWCCVNSCMGEYAFGAQELKGWSTFRCRRVALWWLTSRAWICIFSLAKDRPVIKTTLAIVRSFC